MLDLDTGGLVIMAMGYDRESLKSHFQGLKDRITELYPGDNKGKHISRPDLPENHPRIRYFHPCWCAPELIYDDESDNCQVWLHNRIQ